MHGSPRLRAVVAEIAQPVRVPEGTTMFRKDDEGDTFYLLEAGEIEISVTSPEGRKLTLEILAPPDVFGEIGLFAGRRTADATALTEVRLKRVRRSDLMARIKTEPDIAIAVIDLLCARLRSVNEKLEERAFLPLPVRLARKFLYLAETYADRGGTIPLSQGDLADITGATREGVAKTLAQWKQRGWIEISRGAVHLRNRHALVAVSAGEGEE
jgi:CRP-like cAMP-binding protein